MRGRLRWPSAWRPTSVAEGRLHDVAIVGFGPTGAVLANLLGAAGLSVLVIEREAAIYPLPRAIHFDGEVMRVFQAAGLRDAVLAIARPGTEGMHFVNPAGQTLLIRGGTALEGPHGCANNYYFHQPELEQVLRDGARRHEGVEVRLHHAATAIEPKSDHVELALQDRTRERTATARARYVVGCDGARSVVRDRMGSPMRELGLSQAWLVFDVILQADMPGLPNHTVQYCDPARPMTYCNVVGRRRRWEIMVMPGDDVDELIRPASLWPLVARWIGPDQARLERAVVYTFRAAVAERWRQGRLLLAGDACHLTPPFLGQGMCAGVRDAANLAWKLAAVVRGRAGEALLDSYEPERAPHVTAFIELAVRLGDLIQTTDPVVAAARDARFRTGGTEVFEFPSPRLGPGRFDPAPDGPGGRPFPQPRLDDGTRLDDRIGAHACILGVPALFHALPAGTLERWRDAGVVVIDDSGAEVGRWLARHGASAVVLRPDRYVVGVARTVADLDRLLHCLDCPEPVPA